MPHLSEVRLAWDKATPAQRKRLALLLAAKCDLLEARERERGPLVVIHSAGFPEPTPEEIERARTSRFPTVHVWFGKPEDGHSLGTSTAEGA